MPFLLLLVHSALALKFDEHTQIDLNADIEDAEIAKE